MQYSYKQQYPITWEQIPHRIRLSNGFTRTDKSTFTEEELIDAGYIQVEDSPATTGYQKATWTGTSWIIEEMTDSEKEARISIMWNDIRNSRNIRIQDVMWRIQRYESEMRLGLHPTDDITKLDAYVQALRDITKQEDPTNIIWPELDINN